MLQTPIVPIMENITPPMPAKRALAVIDQPVPADIGPPKRISKRSAPQSTPWCVSGEQLRAGLRLRSLIETDLEILSNCNADLAECNRANADPVPSGCSYCEGKV
jgi:hypothetical protein